MNPAAPAVSLSLTALLHQPVTDSDGHRRGVLADVVVQLGRADHPPVTGLLVASGGTRSYVAAEHLAALGPGQARLAAGAAGLCEFRRREDEVLLSGDVLGHRLVDLARAALGKAYDVRLSPVVGGWAATGLDVHRLRWLSPGPHHAAHAPRDWTDFEPLLGHAESAQVRAAASRVHRLKPARIAGIIEETSRAEQDELLARLREHPELEADVFERLDRPV